MKKNYIKLIAIILVAILLVVSAVNLVFAISTDKAKELIDVERKCSLTLTYKHEETKYKDLEIEVYRIADVTENFQYTLVSELAENPINLNAIEAQSEWDAVRDTVGMYVSAGKISALAKKTTDENGVVTFTDIKPGIVYVRWTGNKTDLNVEGFAPFVMEIPKLGEDGIWNYDINALPKPGYDVLDREEKTIIKLWKDEGHTDERPNEVVVEIYKDGSLYEEVALNAENNWSYTWKTEIGFDWAVIEKSIPEGYSSTTEFKDGKFMIVNTYDKETPPPPPPATGDNSNIVFWAIMMTVSGVILVLLAVVKRRNNEN